MKLYYCGKPADGFGWGVANTNLIQSLKTLCDVEIPDPGRRRFDSPVFVPITDHNLNPIQSVKKAPMVIGYCFTEWPLSDVAVKNSLQYDLIFTGSTWNTIKLRANGIKHADTLIQGVDFDLFTPQPPSERKGFVVFSGGKYEFRKGQDYVLAAMKVFMRQRADAVLLTSWFNPWPDSEKSMERSWLIDPKKPFDGLPEDRVIKLPALKNAAMPALYQQAHVGLFPNRCEAGTNMVMTEFMACSRPVIATFAHGHYDVLNGDGPFHLTNGDLDPAGWFNCHVSDIIACLESAYEQREALEQRGALCRKLVEKLTWDDCAQKIVRAAFSSTASPAQSPGRDAPPPARVSQS
jgi:glycosyltransferase involved in cell wall biosynthesis